MVAFKELDLGGKRAGGLSLLDALQLEGTVRLTLLLGDHGPEDVQVSGLSSPSWQGFGSSAVVTGKAGKEEVVIGFGDTSIRADPTARQTAFLAGCNVGLAVRLEERVGTAVDWLKWHRDQHGMTGALIVDRAEQPGFAAKLKRASADMGDISILVVRPSVPLGKAGLGREADPFYAPDAPGRDRMSAPAPDPWLAPLGEVILYEVLRHRFLADARAVMNIDLSDLLAKHSGSGPTVFDAALSSESGVVALSGRHAYPWRLPRGRSVGFADHICLVFDRASLRRRWCVAPAKVDPSAYWRLLRIAGAAADPKQNWLFWRCMALRHPGQRVAVLVPKSALIENEQLRETTAEFGAKDPIQMPTVELHTPKDTDTITLITSMKNEGPFIVDWIAWHRAIGADRFLIYSNDCTDGTEELLSLLDRKGVIHHRNNDGYRATGLTPQHSVLAAADEDPITRSGDWLLFTDCDEYVNIKVGDGRFADLFSALPQANMISMTWRLFGNADIHQYEDVPVVDQFTQCAPELCRKPHQAWGFKTLFRNQGIFRKLGVHRPKGLNPQLIDHINWVNGSGAPMPLSMFRNGWRSTTGTYGYDIVQLNHYAVRSAESFLVKRERGRANHITRDQGLGYWFRMNNNRMAGETNPKAKALFEAEKARMMADEDIRLAHELAVSRHRRRIAELLSDPFYAEFFDTLTGPRMERLSRLLGHFGAGVFQSGPTVVPDERVFGAWKDGDFFTVPLPETDQHGF